MKKILISLLLSVFIILNLSQTTMAQGGLSNVGSGAENLSTWYSTPFNDWFAKVYNQNTSPPSEIFGERYTAAQVQWIFYSLISLPLTIDPDIAEFAGCVFETLGGQVTEANGISYLAGCAAPATKIIGGVIQMIYPQGIGGTSQNSDNVFILALNSDNRPLSGIGYFKNLASNLTVIDTVYAQGFGYNRLQPIQTYWAAARDIAYGLIVLVVIIFSFMIMFRVKITPQLVISVQSALPKVAIALILATFSYAIAGFAIDLMYLFGGFLALILSGIDFTNQMTAGDIYTHQIFPYNLGGLYFFFAMIGYAIAQLITLALNLIASILTFNVPGVWLPNAVFGIVMILVIVWLVILSFWYTFKANWMLIKTLISVYVAIITAPIQFVIGALVPSFGFSNWFKKIMADLLVFPITALLFVIATNLLWISLSMAWSMLRTEFVAIGFLDAILGNSGGSEFLTLWVPEIVGFGEAAAPIIIQLMSFGVIILIPKVPDAVKMVLLGEKFAYGSAIGEAMEPVDWAKKTAPYRAISDISQAEGAAKLLGSKIPLAIANKLGYEDNLMEIVNKMKKQVISSR